ncbi:hypothetical protein L3Y34_018258 [Caenorhabditis briggsae]|uniref:Uncharacterized protein n=1 Tax=Caenorhabditis briggsae TaxID=6238 RepID=A0AAE9DJN3_CAEBR|nr:hypothetical protein L3Y34_018258 [Caenorhabditis briggsae]
MRKQINKSTTHLDTFLFFFCWVDANVGRLLRSLPPCLSLLILQPRPTCRDDGSTLTRGPLLMSTSQSTKGFELLRSIPSIVPQPHTPSHGLHGR